MKTWAWGAISILAIAGISAGTGCGSDTTNPGGGGNSSDSTKTSDPTTNPQTTSTTGPTSTHSSSTGPTLDCTGDQVTGDTTCDTCIDANCCAEVSDCLDPSSVCGMFEACISSGGTPTDCESSNPGGTAAFQKITTCQDAKCASECPTPVCDSGITVGGLDCGNCLTTSCCTEFTNVANAATGLDDFNKCSSDPTCNGDMDAQKAFACRKDHCDAECHEGQICDSGIGFNNPDAMALACAACLGSKCCAPWTALGGMPNAIADLMACSSDPTCNGDQAAVDSTRCELCECKTECGDTAATPSDCSGFGGNGAGGGGTGGAGGGTGGAAAGGGGAGGAGG